MGKKLLCASVSQEACESFIGTAPRADLWILLEYAGQWESKAIAKSTLPAQVKAWLKNAKTVSPHVHTQFIKHHTRPGETITCFIGVSQETRQALYQFQLKSYEDILDLNIPAIVAGSALYETFLFKEPLFLVCTHEKHNRCCGTFGLPVYAELVNVVGENTWQTSHLGGDKFAANVVCLPYGVYYGCVTIPEIEAIVHATRHQQIYTETYRGRTCYSPAVQVADAFVRKLLGRRELHAFQLRSVQDIAADQWTISFESQEDHMLHQLSIAKEKSSVAHYSACLEMETSLLGSYRLSTYEVQESGVKRS
jgi:hypothetical protein